MLLNGLKIVLENHQRTLKLDKETVCSLRVMASFLLFMLARMTEAERLRAQADRCIHLAKQTADRAIAGVLIGLAAKSSEQASDLERAAVQRRQPM